MSEEYEILLVEDNVNDAELIIRALKKGNLSNNLIHLKDGADAIDFMFGENPNHEKKFKRNPKLIVLDLKMPKMNGLDVLKRIKSDETTKSIPIVVFTSSKETADVEKSYLLGANSYIVKPVEYDLFRSVVSEMGVYWLNLNHTPQ